MKHLEHDSNSKSSLSAFLRTGVCVAALLAVASSNALAGGSGGGGGMGIGSGGGGGAGGGAGSGDGGGGGGASVNGNSGGSGGNGSGFGGAPGGNGGNGGPAPVFGQDFNGNGGGGGGGGTGYVATSSFTNSGTISGGNGGGGGGGSGGGQYGEGAGGGGGGGGSGVEAASGLTIVNSGVIQGGNGGGGGAGGGFIAGPGGAGSGGAGIVGQNLTITNSGTIAGGTGAGGRADAITLTGGANTLSVGAGGAFTGNISINGNGTLTIDQSANAAMISAAITGNGSLIKTGADTITLSAANTYAGGTTVNAGTLAVGAGGSMPSSGALNLMNAGAAFDISGANAPQTIGSLTGVAGTNVKLGSNTLRFGDATNQTFAGTIEGTGGLIKQGSGTQTLIGANSYSGGTTINSGTLAIGPGGSLSAFGIVNLANTGVAFDISGASADQTVGGLSGTAGSTVTLGGRNLTLANATNQTFNGTITGTGGLIKEGSGTQILAGTNSYTGNTIIDAGTLAVNGSIVSSPLVTVNNGGILAGTGTVGATMVNAGGTLAPSSGGLQIRGDLTLAAGSTYQTQYSNQIATATVYGTVTLNGGTMVVDYSMASYIPKRGSAMLYGENGVKGTFSNLVNVNLPAAYSATIFYSNNMVLLDLELNASTLMGSSPTRTQARVATAITNSFNTAGGIPMAFGALSPAQLHQVSGETATGAQATAMKAMDHFTTLMTDPSAMGRVTAAVPLSYAPLPRGMPSLMVLQPPRWTVWAAGFGGVQNTRGDAAAGTNSYNGGVYGIAAGTDYHVTPDTFVGFSLGGAGANYHLANGLGGGSSNMFKVGIYGRHNFGSAYVTAGIGHGWQDVTTDRLALFDQLRARFTTTALSGRLETGYRFATPLQVGLTPYAAAHFTSVASPAYREQTVAGPGLFALAYAARRATPWRTELGLRTDTTIAMGEADLTIRSRLGWSHNFNIDRSVLASFAGLPASLFIVDGAPVSRNILLASVGAEMKWRNGWSVGATFEGEFSRNSNSYAGKGSLRYSW